MPGPHFEPGPDRSVETGNPWAHVIPEPWPAGFTPSANFFKPQDPARIYGPQDDARATQYVDNGWRMSEHVDIGRTYELARLYCPRGNMLIVHRIDTFIFKNKTVYGHADDPYQWERAYPGTRITWRLQLESPRQLGWEPWNAAGQPNLMPGVPHPQMGAWNDQRFAWGQTFRGVRLLVPEDKWIRLYIVTQANEVGDAPDEVGGHLAGLLATYNANDVARVTARQGW